MSAEFEHDKWYDSVVQGDVLGAVREVPKGHFKVIKDSWKSPYISDKLNAVVVGALTPVGLPFEILGSAFGAAVNRLVQDPKSK
jgi:hypothetical protein